MMMFMHAPMVKTWNCNFVTHNHVHQQPVNFAFFFGFLSITEYVNQAWKKWNSQSVILTISGAYLTVRRMAWTFLKKNIISIFPFIIDVLLPQFPLENEKEKNPLFCKLFYFISPTDSVFVHLVLSSDKLWSRQSLMHMQTGFLHVTTPFTKLLQHIVVIISLTGIDLVTGMIIAAIVSGIIFVIVIAVFCFFMIQRYRQPSNGVMYLFESIPCSWSINMAVF